MGKVKVKTPFYTNAVLVLFWLLPSAETRIDSKTQWCFHCRPDERQLYADCTNPMAKVKTALTCPVDALGCLTMSISQAPKVPETFFKGCYSPLEMSCMKHVMGVDISTAPCGEFTVTSEQFYYYYNSCATVSSTLVPKRGDGKKENGMGNGTTIPSAALKRRRKRDEDPQEGEVDGTYVDADMVETAPFKLYADQRVRVKYCLCSGDVCNVQWDFDKAEFQKISDTSGGGGRLSLGGGGAWIGKLGLLAIAVLYF